ncbi:MAG TPA: di-heme oxidoredictase family protein [Polyangium sp.]|nr:di-heme oxidoredictase family protein [Polyangium sp.]
MSASRIRLRFAFALLGSGFLAAAGGEAPIPWPHGDPPSPQDIATSVDEALRLAHRERFEEFTGAVSEFDDREHITIRQNEIDAQLYTPDDLFRFGDSLFTHEFRAIDGSGDPSLPQLRRVHSRLRGGSDTYSCAGCHSVGGLDGAGSLAQNAFLNGDGEHLSSTNVRNAPPLLGVGFVQMLAEEMSASLAQIRDRALSRALETNAPATLPLMAKDISFGSITVTPEGVVDTSQIEGVDEDLVIKPFAWKGTIAKLRRFAEEAARIHFGVQSHVLAEQWKVKPDIEKLGSGPNWYDPDNDGIQREIEEGVLTAAAAYMTQLEVPVILPPYDAGLRQRWAHGQELFTTVGCADCHREQLILDIFIFRDYPDTTGGPPVEFNIIAQGEKPRGNYNIRLFSDLKRHDMGPELADAHDEPGSNIPRSVFLTRPLWGLAESAPYMHDGRATTIPDAILAHGGDAQKARDAFVDLDPEAQKDLHVFLLSLTREPRLGVLP